MAYTNINTERALENINGDLVVVSSNVLNNETIGVNVDVTKENLSGAGFTSNVYGVKSYAKGNSSETIVNIGGAWSKAEHIGEGTSYYITGGTNRAYHNGSGDSTSIVGTFSEALIGGDGEGNHTHLMGLSFIAKLDNPNADLEFLTGIHSTMQLGDGEVTGASSGILIDFDKLSGSGVISGDLEYLKIQNDVLPTITGTARAIHSDSTLPSLFRGSIKSAGFTDSAITEHTDNAAAITAGLAVGTHYRTGDLLKIVH